MQALRNFNTESIQVMIYWEKSKGEEWKQAGYIWTQGTVSWSVGDGVTASLGKLARAIDILKSDLKDTLGYL